jgi:hypothetical protein
MPRALTYCAPEVLLLHEHFTTQITPCRLVLGKRLCKDFLEFIRLPSPIARLKFSMSTSVFFTSLLYTSLPTMGQNGTCSSNCLQQL